LVDFSSSCAIYHVFISAPGETVSIAEEMAARDALSKLMNVSFSSKPLQWSEQSKDFKLSYERQNQSINEKTSQFKDLLITSHM
jgi:hypothetical protein